MRYGIAFKLGLLLASFGVVAMGIVGYYAYASSRATLLNAAQRDLLTATQVLGRNFKASIDKIADDALLLASLPTTPALANDPEGAAVGRDKKLLAETFAAMMALHPEYFQIRLIGAEDHGLELVRLDRDGDRLLHIAVADLQEKAHYPYVFNTLQLRRGQVYLSNITINHEEGVHSGLHKPAVRVATPVVAADGKVLGLIVINLDLGSLFARLKSDLPNAYQLYLSNHWGDYLIHPNPAQAFGFDQGRRIFIQEYFEPVAALINGQSASVVTSIEGVEQAQAGLVAAFVRLPFGGSVEQHFVILGLSQPLENVVRETRRLGWTTVPMILALGLLAVLLAALVSRVVTRPLRAMVHAVGLFSKEQVVSQLPSTREDEVGLLAQSLNDMQATIVANMRELNESRQALKHLAQHDPLTGLPNRALFDDRLSQAVSQARRDQIRMALLFVDLDGFKAINDTHGHHVGDCLLNAAAKRMQACVRGADTVGRLGGDEFVILLPHVEAVQDALLVAEKICVTLNQPFEVDGRHLDISSSIGVAIFPEHGGNELTLSQSADAAMYLAKESGGNRVRLCGA
jgi:diguanylate cyclase (GGDEF)-like protein